MHEPTLITVEAEIARVTAQRDGEDANQRQQDAWLARRYTTLTEAGMAPRLAAKIVTEYQRLLWGAPFHNTEVIVHEMGENDDERDQ